MEIELELQPAELEIELELSESIRYVPVEDHYTGETTVTPSAQTQTLQTGGLYLDSDITIQPIPQNYGLITYNGAIITVS